MIGRRPRDGRLRPGWLMIVGFAAAMTPSVPARTAEPACAVPAELMDVDGKLPRLAKRLEVGGPVKIVAIGGASTAGLAAGSLDFAYPQRMRQALARWYPAVSITVVNKSLPHQTAEQMLARFPSDVFAENPVLVIWETGTTDAVRGVGVDAFAATLQSGADAVAARGIDLILVDMQFSHRTVAVIDFESYLRAMHRVGDVNDVYVFPRFAMMRYWSDQEVFNLDGVQKDERSRLAADVYQCLGRKLAEAIRVALQ
jgi:acyl-CoA thioesterase I